MSILIAYYSRTGKNEELAKLLREKLDCEIEKIEEFTNRRGVLGFLKSGMQSTLKKRTEIKPPKKNPGDYDVIVVVSPIWAGFIPPPIRTYVYNFRGKFNRLAYASISYSGYGNSKVLKDLESLALQKVDAHLLLKEKVIGSLTYSSMIETFLDSLGKL